MSLVVIAAAGWQPALGHVVNWTDFPRAHAPAGGASLPGSGLDIAFTGPGESRAPIAGSGLLSPRLGGTPVLSRAGTVFELDGIPIEAFGIRAANALESDEITQRLIANLDSMRTHGIQSVNLSLQGGKTGTANAFNADGSLKAVYMTRLAAVLDALAARDMVAVVTYFYQARDQQLANDDAVRAAVSNATEALAPWRNVWLYVINEWYHSGFDRAILKTPAGQQEIYSLIKSIDPERVTFVSNASGANDGFNANTGRTAANGNVVTEYQRQDEYNAPGIFTSGEHTTAQQDAETTLENGGYWFWHAAWHQKVDASNWPRFDAGGTGTASDPGVDFIWSKLDALSDAGPGATPTAPSATPSPISSPTPTSVPATATPLPSPTASSTVAPPSPTNSPTPLPPERTPKPKRNGVTGSELKHGL